MNKTLLLIITFLSCALASAQVQTATADFSPTTFRANNEVTLTISGVNPENWNAGQADNIYIWAWYYDLNGPQAGNSPTNGDWDNSNESQKLTNNNDGTYSFTFTPSTFFGTTDISKIGFLVKADNGDGDKKSQDMAVDLNFNVLTVTSPSQYLTVGNSGTIINVSATTTETSNFTLKANGLTVNTGSGTSYDYNYSMTADVDLILEADDTHFVLSKSFKGRLTPSSPVPTGMLDGLNINPSDNTKATFVIYAPGKSTVHLIGNFNGWSTTSLPMNHDTARDRFWLELTSLNPTTDYKYQYLIDSSIRVADPYSTLILDESHDSGINSTTYPDMPSYPTGLTNHAVSTFKTGETAYSWNVTNFLKPAKEDLVIYEILIRDFDALHSFDAVKARLDYIEDLGINAIQLMPINEFDDNESWGYNPSFHMALDKYYGTKTALKELIDECHSRGIAVIIDVVYNHASGENPFYRMWNTDGGGYNGQATASNPFFNATAKHSYNVFNDMNHDSNASKEYIERIVTYWIEEFKIDGFRWDLTKGFTQHCSDGDDSCTNDLNRDRLKVLKEYSDYQWASDSDFYIIFEHLGTISEEKQWADYRAGEGKGIMLWNKLTDPYNEATMGYNSNSNFENTFYTSKGFDGPSGISYMESHDEERLMHKNLMFGGSNGGYNVKDLDTALERMQAAGAFFFSIPGPKMIWQFGELGYDISIDFNGRTGNKPIKWEYYDDPERRAIYDAWARIINLKLSQPIFNTTDVTMDLGNSNGLKSIHLTLDAASGTDIKHLVVIGNFGTSTQVINPAFQVAGTWEDLMDESGSTTIDGSTTSINLAPGTFKIYGVQAASLSIEEKEFETSFTIYPNPSKGTFKINKAVEAISIFNLTGKEVKSFKGNFNKGHSFDITSLPRSFYIIKANTNTGNEWTKKLIKL